MFRDATRVDAAAGRSQVPGAHAGYHVIADEYYELRHITSRNFDSATRDHLRQRPPLLPGHGMALDLGAGRGRLAEYCGVDLARVVQADVALRMLTPPERELALGRVVADARALPFKTGAFTIVAAFLFDPFNQGRLFTEVARVLSPGGIFIGTIPHYDWGLAFRSEGGKALDEAVFVLKNGEQSVQPSFLSPPHQLANGLTGAGLQGVKIESLTLPKHVGRVSPDIETAARAMGESVYRVPIVQLVMGIRK